MEPMFTVDMKDYDGTERRKYKTAARGIIRKDGKLALVHSTAFGYYKFPGGGLEKDESLIDALIREVREESGLDVIPSSVREFGMAKRIEKASWNHILDQDSYYFTCEVSDTMYPQELGDNEKIAGFVLEYIDPEDAVEANERYLSENNYGAIIRDTRVLRMLIR